MKNLLFSAIALVAFSGVSTASTMDITVPNHLIDEITEIDCYAVAIAALNAADPNNTMTQKEAHSFYQGQFNACEKSKQPSISQ